MSQRSDNSIDENNYKVFLPAIIKPAIPEIDVACRWPYYVLWDIVVDYRWEGLLTLYPTNPWRIAFQDSIDAWDNAPINVSFEYNAESENYFALIYSETYAPGTSFMYYIDGTCTHFDILGNLYWDQQNNYTSDERQTLAAHEVGHSISLGHIDRDSYPSPVVMHPILFDFELAMLVIPQPPDIALVNQVFP